VLLSWTRRDKNDEAEAASGLVEFRGTQAEGREVRLADLSPTTRRASRDVGRGPARREHTSRAHPACCPTELAGSQDGGSLPRRYSATTGKEGGRAVNLDLIDGLEESSAICFKSSMEGDEG
jgi:hypothetical protein